MIRRHDIDALRALAFALVILYHVGMFYVQGWPWHLKSLHATEWLQWPMRIVGMWRMDLVFLISGVALGFLRHRSNPLQLFSQRSLRLLVPLAFGMALLVPFQPYAQGVANGLVEPGFAKFLARYYTGGPWQRGAFDGWQYGITWNHLWYLAYLWAYTVLLIVLTTALESRAGKRIRTACVGLRGWALLLLPALPLAVYTFVLQPRFPATHDLVSDWYLHAVYFTVFLYGYWMGADTGLWAELSRLRHRALCVALTMLAGYFVLMHAVPGEQFGVRWAVTRLIRDLYLWSSVVAILGYAHAHLNRQMAWLPWARESVYPWYLLHQTLIIGIAHALFPFRAGPVLEPLLVLGGTLLGCWLITDGLVRRVGWLRPLFGLKIGELKWQNELRSA